MLFEASVGSATTSLASSIAKYRVENGRTYHAYKEGCASRYKMLGIVADHLQLIYCPMTIQKMIDSVSST